MDSNLWLSIKAQSGALLLIPALSSEKENVAVGIFLIGHCTHLSPPTAVAA